MGAGASTVTPESLPPTVDKAMAQSTFGALFDEAEFDKAAIDGVVSREAVLAAAGTNVVTPPLVKRTPSGKKLSEVTGDEVPVTKFDDQAEDHGTTDEEDDEEAGEEEPKQEAQSASMTPACGRMADADERTAVTTALRDQFQKSGRQLMSPDDPRFFHGWAYCGEMATPHCLWKSDQKPRKDHAAPDWLTASEYEDAAEVTAAKIEQLVKLLRLSKHTVVYSGAGISASAVGQAAASGVNKQGWLAKTKAKPTMTHHALAILGRAGLIHGWVQQNHEYAEPTPEPRSHARAEMACRGEGIACKE